LQIKEYGYRKANRSLLVHSVQDHLNTSLAQVGLSFSRDGNVHIGQHVMIFSVETQGVLSCDIADRISLVNPSFMATTSTVTKGNVARNTFVIEAADRKAAPGSVLTYNQQFRLRLNPIISSTPVYLTSQPLSPLASSKVSRRQLVAFSAEANFDTVWMCHYIDHQRRFEMEGQPVTANAEMVFVHCATRNPLCTETKYVYHNDFGAEFEVCCSPAYSGMKKHEITHEFKGMTTPDIASRGEMGPNRFAILTAADESSEELISADGMEVERRS